MQTGVVQPYLFFGGRCDEALAFYAQALGAKTEFLMRFNESPEPPPPGMLPADWGAKVMHASVRIGSTQLMASDGCGEPLAFKGFSLALTLAAPAEAERAFAALSAGGSVQMPLTKTFWSPSYGMLTDRFGVAWMVMVLAAECPTASPK